VNVQLDHVHLVLVIPPRVSVAQVVQFMKSQTGKALSSKFKFIRKAMRDKEGMWSRGYCVSSIGLNEKTILRYVEHQEREDKGQLKLDLGTRKKPPAPAGGVSLKAPPTRSHCVTAPPLTCMWIERCRVKYDKA